MTELEDFIYDVAKKTMGIIELAKERKGFEKEALDCIENNCDIIIKNYEIVKKERKNNE